MRGEPHSQKGIFKMAGSPADPAVLMVFGGGFPRQKNEDRWRPGSLPVLSPASTWGVGSAGTPTSQERRVSKDPAVLLEWFLTKKFKIVQGHSPPARVTATFSKQELDCTNNFTAIVG